MVWSAQCGRRSSGRDSQRDRPLPWASHFDAPARGHSHPHTQAHPYPPGIGRRSRAHQHPHPATPYGHRNPDPPWAANCYVYADPSDAHQHAVRFLRLTFPFGLEVGSGSIRGRCERHEVS